MSFHVPEAYRIHPSFDPGSGDAGNGYFDVPSRSASRLLTIIASNGEGWEHVSVHAIEKGRARTPSWPEMCQIKDLFWDEEDVVIQYHPRASEYVSFHETTLHLWRPIGIEIPTPPPILVGPLPGTAEDADARRRLGRAFGPSSLGAARAHARA